MRAASVFLYKSLNINNMKKLIIILANISFLAGIANGLYAQRPVGDTIIMGSSSDYWYDSLYLDPGITVGYNPSSNPRFHRSDVDYYWYVMRPYFYNLLLQEMSWDTLLKYYPELTSCNGGIFISGMEYETMEDMMVLGLAVCPTIHTDPVSHIEHVIDTSMVNRLTEYVQLYTMEGGTPHLRAEGPWRWEDPHRYMLFPNTFDVDSGTMHVGMTSCAPLYECMFDTGVYIEAEKIQSFMVAGTHNNNGVVWADTCYDTIFPEPQMCIEHYATTYSCIMTGVENWYQNYNPVWIKYRSFPWSSFSREWRKCDYNIFPILDTLFGAPCAAVTGLQTVEVDSLWATLMWSADARHHDWEVMYRPTCDSLASDSVVTVNVPEVMLTGLTPGMKYSVSVRGRCDIYNYSPWCDTLLFVTPYTPPDTTPDTVPYIRPHTLDLPSIGNLDRYTRIIPNPAHDVVNVLSSYQLQSVAVYDLTGRQMLEQPAEGLTTTVNVSSLPHGTYILVIRTLQGVASKRLLVGGEK